MRHVAETTVVVRDPCRRCDGTGVVYDPTGFYTRAAAAGVMSPGVPHGAWERYMLAQGVEEAPPEEGMCRDCEGAGRVEREITLSEFAGLLDRVEAHQAVADIDPAIEACNG